MKAIFKKSVAKGEVTPPPSKSITHRAIICASLTKGETVIENPLFCDDVWATIDCVKSLGAEITVNESQIIVKGVENLPKKANFYCRESASTLRFFIPICVFLGVEGYFYVGESLEKRPNTEYFDFFKETKVLFEKIDNYYHVKGKLNSGNYVISGKNSSQFISGLLLALSVFSGESLLTVKGKIASLPYVNLTCEVLKTFNCNVAKFGKHFKITDNISNNKMFYIESDWSNVANLLCYNYKENLVTVNNLNNESVQGDKIVLKLFEKIKKKKIKIDIANYPDIAPILICYSLLFDGVVLFNTNRLKYKESDRVGDLVCELKKINANIEVQDNCIEVFKSNLAYNGITLNSHNDHRLVMAFSFLLSILGGEMDGVECVKKSYPNFFEHLKKLNVDFELI